MTNLITFLYYYSFYWSLKERLGTEWLLIAQRHLQRYQQEWNWPSGKELGVPLQTSLAPSRQHLPPVYPYLAQPCFSFSLAVIPSLSPKPSILQLCCESSIGGSYTTMAACEYSTAENKAVMKVSVAGFPDSSWEEEEHGMTACTELWMGRVKWHVNDTSASPWEYVFLSL